MFINISDYNGTVLKYTDHRTDFSCFLFVNKTQEEPEVTNGIYYYDVFLMDCCPFHDLSLKICHEELSGNKYKTEEERLSILEKKNEMNLGDAINKFDHIIMTSYPSCEECPYHNHHDML